MSANLRRILLASLLDELGAKGYPLGPGKLLQVEALLQGLPADTPPEALRTLLAPLFASSPQEQRLFYELFEGQLKAVREKLGGEGVGDEGPGVPKAEPLRTEVHWRRYALAALLLLAFTAGIVFDPKLWPTWAFLGAVLLCAGLAGWKLPPSRAARFRYLAGAVSLVLAGILVKRALVVPPRDRDVEKSIEVKRFAVEQGGQATRQVGSPTDTARLRYAVRCDGQSAGETSKGGFYRFDSLGNFTYSASAPAGSSDSICALAVYGARTDSILFIADIIPVSQKPDEGPATGGLDELPLPFPGGLEALLIDPDAKRRADLYHQYRWPLKGCIFLLLVFFSYALANWYERRRARFVAEIEDRDRPPYVWHLHTGEDLKVAFEEGLAMLLNRLRRRGTGSGRRLDIPSTVRASARSGGRATWIFRRQTYPPEYLLLIDRHDANDHRARLFDALYGQLREAEVLVERFFYNGDPRTCFNEGYPHGVALTELAHRYRDARLLLLGEGYGLQHPQSGALAPWTGVFNSWRNRAILLYGPTGTWGKRVETLAGLFTVVPATSQGLDIALEQFETLEVRPPKETVYKVNDAEKEPVVFSVSLLSTLQRYYSPPMIRWIAACAVYPVLHWDLTLYLGREVGDAEGPTLLTSDNLRQLNRLPWFVEGRIPESPRLQLLEYLQKEGLEEKVRRALDRLFSQVPGPPPDSVAYDDYRMNVILNKLLLKPESEARRALEEEFSNYLAAGRQPDFVTFKQLERELTPLDYIAPERWKKYLFRHGMARLGLKVWPVLGVLWALLALGIAFAPVKTKVCKGEEVTYEEQSLCLDSPSDRLRYLEYLTRDAIEAQDYERADSLRLEAGALARSSVPVADTVPYYRNTAVWYYNYGVRAYNCSRGGANGCPQLGADSLLSQACDNFRRGEALYVSVMGTAGIEFYGAQRLACRAASATLDDTSTFTLRGWVLDAADGKAIAGAQVQARTEGGRYTAQSDTEGRYVLERVRPSVQLVLEATAEGYDRSSLNVAVTTELPPLRLQRPYAARSAAAWARALAADTPEAVSEYLRLFPDGPEAGQARKWLADRASTRERADWEAALRANTIEAYTAHKRRYPSGVYTAEADKRLAELQEVADFEAAVAQNTVAAYRGYLEKYPDGARAGEARSQLNALQAAAEEAQAWQSARTENTPAAYRRYLEAWPQGKHAAEARGYNGSAPTATGPAMVTVPGGTFDMGDVMGDKEQTDETVHGVTLGAFQIGAYEVTFEEYDAFCTATKREKPSDSGWGRGKRPVINVSWEDVVAYCNWRSKQEGLQEVYTISGSSVSANWQANGYRLPTEAEWEYAARAGGKKVRFGNGKDIADPKEINFDASAKYKRPYSIVGEYRGKTLPVGSFAPNALGLYDMSGNVSEWCWDWYGNYPTSAQTNPKGPGTSSYRVLRGGSWSNDPQSCRVANRDAFSPGFRIGNFGFRLSRTL